MSRKETAGAVDAAAGGNGKTPAADAAYKEFTRLQFWFIRQVIVDVPECAAVAVVLADHCSRTTGLMFPSVATIAHHTGRSARAVQPYLARLEKRGHIAFAGWVRAGGHANVRAWRWLLWDHRVERRFDQDLLGIRSTGRKLPEQNGTSERPLRKKPAGAKKTASEDLRGCSGRIPSSGSEDSGVLVRKESSDKPSMNRHLNRHQPSAAAAAVRSATSQPSEQTEPAESGSRLTRSSGQTLALEETIGEVRNPISLRRPAAWPIAYCPETELAYLERMVAEITRAAHADPSPDLEDEQIAAQRSLTEAIARRIPSHDRRRYEVAARERRRLFLAVHRTSSTPKATMRETPTLAASVEQQRVRLLPSPRMPRRQREFLVGRVQTALWNDGQVRSAGAYLANQIRVLVSEGFDIERDVLPALRLAAAAGDVPRDPEAIKRKGVFRGLIERHLEHSVPLSVH